mmetsp:Transcript_1794/g.5233  ORF Transcript_1794/g.5233 Transcript_1794/m.5233 type:complete len:413 (-) Transcript_1794:499-1737(-)|eukprot:CAMPEP_0117682894 /NCGR_PEP_ID=MMETSP0804-20121206/19995_1 /TAXON_ID=1074897 /ORGANISM="Tetraselmis astigmatica, Strain CCMP880" /LENGTH=412 /DNA_ID=CAMNT_0005493221 /DNA_START=207 /DNA_END=1445 /DNA_ORIENTATION=-
MLALGFDQPPESLRHCHQDFAGWPSEEKVVQRCPNSNFLKGLKWAPDGCCLLTASDDGWYRVFDLPQDALGGPSAWPDSWPAGLRIPAGELIYDYTWYPGFNTSQPQTCCFLSSTRAHPLHLWDACCAELRCSYRAYDAVDEITAAHSVAFNRDGSKIYAGYNKVIRVFETSRPGREYRTATTQNKALEGGGLIGIVSCMAFDPSGSPVYAAGTYSRAVGVFQADTNQLEIVLHGHRGGVTQLQFSPDGNYLYSGARKDGEIICWDIRFTPGPVYRMQRDTAATNQRIQFDIEPCGRHLASGGEDGQVRTFDLQTGELRSAFAVASDTVNGLQFHPTLPLAATASGQRRYPLSPSTDSDSDSEEAPVLQREGSHQQGVLERANSNCLRLWRFPYEVLQLEAEPTGEPDAMPA